MTLRSNIIFDPISSIEVFMDNVREVQSEHIREVLNYPSANVAEIKIHARHRMPTPWNYVGTLQEDIIEKKRKMVYLEAYAENTIVVDGGNNNAVYGSTRNLRMANQNTSVCNIEFVQLSKGGVTGQYYDAEDLTLASGATVVSDSDAAMGECVALDTQYDKTIIDITQSDWEFPEGDYKVFTRAKDTNQVTDDLALFVRNETDTTYPVNETHTLTAGYKIYISDFTIDSNDVGDSITINASKQTVTSNIIYVDFIGFVKV